jgi:hypothetical protein
VDITRFQELKAPNRSTSGIKTRPQAAADAFLSNVIETMVRVRADRGRGVFALTAANRRAGTSYVVNVLAEQLALQLDATVAVVPTEAMKGVDPKRLPQGFIEHARNIWTAIPDQTLQHMPDFALENVWVSPGATNFDFVLIDCPAVAGSLQTLRWADASDGVFLVVEAGVTRSDEIEAAERALASVPGKRLKGIILNRRTYPIPNCVYNLL